MTSIRETSKMDCEIFFQTATDHPPYDWQKRLAGDAECQSRLIDIPTGLGKTAGVVLAWLYNRLGKDDGEGMSDEGERMRDEWPRRLVYCLPMRTLVEQTAGEVEQWLRNLWQNADELNLSPEALNEVRWLIGAPPNATPSSFIPQPSSFKSPVILMGGEDLSPAKRDWDLYPEKPAILIGTQDMLLSRALNRGYGAGRARWPISFALLNNDALWLKDEVQLMANGLSTSLQLQAWRESLGTKDTPGSITATEKPSTVLPTHTWWMSATMSEHWFQTAVDWRTLNLNGKLAPKKLWEDRLKIEESDKTDKTDTRVSGLLKITKSKEVVSGITPLEATGTRDIEAYAESVATFIANEENRKGKKLESETKETPDLCTLLVVNTIERAVAIHAKIKEKDPFKDNNVLLLHSRFRGAERKHWPAHIKAFEKGDYTDHDGVTNKYKVDGPRLIIATQVIEAGVDLSVPILYTERCPLASLIQRLGRCARRAGKEGKVYILEMELSEETAKPYTKEELEAWQPKKSSTKKSASKTATSETGEQLPEGLGIDSLSTWIERMRDEEVPETSPAADTAEKQANARSAKADASTAP